ncbi:hypothetical protein DEO72_LG5g2402 [Vigna unguiculata]|uniref:Uncharacterized protein n=1 Tax=Vigna unguiculata TaxID=3917 RepID=A0A4D6LZB9_VIGUN|nr:hypothetical protein DEO72_LG5g2402 [Vigna unguiculata]
MLEGAKSMGAGAATIASAGAALWSQLRTDIKREFIDKLDLLFHPNPRRHSVSPPKPIPNWVEEVDLPTEDQNDTINDLRDKCAILEESFSKNQSRDRFTWQDIAQRLVLEGKGTTAEVGATREDFQRLLGEFKNPGESDVYLRV